MIEKNFDIAFIADLALREKQIQQNYRPIIAVHKWFARRPGTLFRGLLLSEFSDRPLREMFYQANRFSGTQVADPFMGGGIPLLEANRIGCDVTGFDINPMAYWIVRQEIEHLNLDDYMAAADSLRETLEKKIGHLYRTRCTECDSPDASVKYFLWIKVIRCPECREDIRLFPGHLIAADARHPKNVFVCPACGELTEADDRNSPGRCGHCSEELALKGPAKRGRCRCRYCHAEAAFPKAANGPPRHHLFALEYHCPICKTKRPGRFFKKPDPEDLAKWAEAEAAWAETAPTFVPDDAIPSGDETNRLHRWGYRFYREMFNARQLLGLETSARLIAAIENERVRNGLATNLSDLLRYQNMVCRYDTRALKSLDIFSVHGFPVGLVQCESNLLGIMAPGGNTCIGSGGWANIIEKYRKAKQYCDRPFEVKHNGRKKSIIPIQEEWIGDRFNGADSDEVRIVNLSCEDAATVKLLPSSLDAVFTDPPYFGNVQYAELMDFCFVWLKRLLGRSVPAFRGSTTRNPSELTGNEDMGRGLDHFTKGLSAVFQKMAEALKPGSPLAFTYHYNKIEAYYPIAAAILDAGLTCSASLPCPAEMGASIHISGTKSSIIDTVFVCRTTGRVSKSQIVESPADVARLVEEDLLRLKLGHVNPTLGDTRCISFGHLIRLAIWSLRKDWDRNDPVSERIARIGEWIRHFGGWKAVGKCLNPYRNRVEKVDPLGLSEISYISYGVEDTGFLHTEKQKRTKSGVLRTYEGHL